MITAADAVSIHTFQVNQPIGEFYVGRLRAHELLKICRFDFRRIEQGEGYVKFIGIQRDVSPKRRKEIAKYAATMDACFPTGVVLSIPRECVQIDPVCDGIVSYLKISAYDDPVDPELSIPLDQIAAIIDGQHRLRGIEDSGVDIEMPVSIFIGSDDALDASIFSVVNLAQTKVNKSLVYDLFELAKARSPEKTAHEITVALDRIQGSPFEGRIKRLGAVTEGRRGETLSQATVVRGLLPYLTTDALADRDRGRRFGFWEPITGPEATRRVLRPFFAAKDDDAIVDLMLNYFSAISTRWPEAWRSTGRGNMINRTNGYNAFMRFFRLAYLYFTETPRVVSHDEFLNLFGRVKLNDRDFNTERFVPGSSGAKALYDTLVRDTGADL